MSKKRFLVLCVCLVTITLLSCCTKKSSQDAKVDIKEANEELDVKSTDDAKTNGNPNDTKNDQSTNQITSLDGNQNAEELGQQITPEMQYILENNEFMNSFEGTQFKVKAYHLAKAFFNGDHDYLKDNLMKGCQLDKYDYKDQFNDIECMYFIFENYDKETNEASGVYAVQLTKDSGFFYLCFTMKYIDDTWKIVDIMVDA